MAVALWISAKTGYDLT